jgi:hypothetical protein
MAFLRWLTTFLLRRITVPWWKNLRPSDRDTLSIIAAFCAVVILIFLVVGGALVAEHFRATP